MEESRVNRLRMLQETTNRPVECPRCKGTWFREEMFQQYNAGIYSSTPGGDLQPISVTPQTIRVCLCGEPISPNLGGTRGGRTGNTELSSFLESLEKAQGLRSGLVEGINHLVEVSASKDGVQSLADEFDQVKQKVEALIANQSPAAPATPAAPDGEPKKGKGKG